MIFFAFVWCKFTQHKFESPFTSSERSKNKRQTSKTIFAFSLARFEWASKTTLHRLTVELNKTVLLRDRQRCTARAPHLFLSSRSKHFFFGGGERRGGVPTRPKLSGGAGVPSRPRGRLGYPPGPNFRGGSGGRAGYPRGPNFQGGTPPHPLPPPGEQTD